MEGGCPYTRSMTYSVRWTGAKSRVVCSCCKHSHTSSVVSYYTTLNKESSKSGGIHNSFNRDCWGVRVGERGKKIYIDLSLNIRYGVLMHCGLQQDYFSILLRAAYLAWTHRGTIISRPTTTLSRKRLKYNVVTSLLAAVATKILTCVCRVGGVQVASIAVTELRQRYFVRDSNCLGQVGGVLRC